MDFAVQLASGLGLTTGALIVLYKVDPFAFLAGLALRGVAVRLLVAQMLSAAWATRTRWNECLTIARMRLR